MEERRKFKRKGFEKQVFIYDISENREYTGFAKNLGPSGIFVETNSFFPIGKNIFLKFPLPIKGVSVMIKGKIVWNTSLQTEGDEKSKKGIGIEFVEIEDWIFEEIYKYIYKKTVKKN